MNAIFQMDLWQLLTLLGGYVVVIAVAGKLLMVQIDMRLKERFTSLAEANSKIAAETRENTEATRNLERDFLKLRADLPLEYVRREDFIRNQSVIEAKLDAVAAHLQNMQLRGAKNG